MKKIGLVSTTAAILVTIAIPAQSSGADGLPNGFTNPARPHLLMIAESRKSVKQLGSKLGGKVSGTGVSELSAQDCTNVGGKVITVTDDRCGASRKYCRMPDTNAVCIDILR